MTKNIVNKPIKKSCNVLGKEATKAAIKANNTDDDGNFYIYDLYDADGNIIALNQYAYKDSDKQPFATLTTDEELVLNPPIVKSIPMDTSIVKSIPMEMI